MAWWRALLAVVFLSAIAGTSALAKGPLGSIHVGLWKGGAFTNDRTGAVSYCAAGTTYQNGTYLILSQSVQNTWTLGFLNQTFNLSQGDDYQIDLLLDGQMQRHLFGSVHSANFIAEHLQNDEIINQIRKSHSMEAHINGITFQFNLTSTGQVISSIENCVAKTRSAGISKFVIESTSAASRNSVGSSKTTKASSQSGTGFVVSNNGHVLTNFHVIDSCVGQINGNLTGEGPIGLRIVATDKNNDLALLQAPKTFEAIAKIRETPVRSGDAIIVIGYPLHGLFTSDFTVTAGIVSSLSGLFNDTRFLQISAGVQPGNSGGPLLDTSGDVVGVVSSKINAIKFAKITGDLPENINFAIKTGTVRDFLDNSAVSYQTAKPKLELKTAEIVQDARAYTMFISCSTKSTD